MIEYKNEILKLLSQVQREGMENLINWLENSDFFEAPASINGHSNVNGGLCEHSWKVYKCFNEKNKLYKTNIPDDSVIITSLLHDVCKCNFYNKIFKSVKVGTEINKHTGNPKAKWVDKETYEINDVEPLGHGEKSIIVLQRFIQLTDWELYAIRWHMGLPETYAERKSFDAAIKKHKSIILLHTSDFESSCLLEKIY